MRFSKTANQLCYMATAMVLSFQFCFQNFSSSCTLRHRLSYKGKVHRYYYAFIFFVLTRQKGKERKKVEKKFGVFQSRRRQNTDCIETALDWPRFSISVVQCTARVFGWWVKVVPHFRRGERLLLPYSKSCLQNCTARFSLR